VRELATFIDMVRQAASSMSESIEAAEKVDVLNCTLTLSTYYLTWAGVKWAPSKATGVPLIMFCAIAVTTMAF